jgi:hypothetical protein
MVLAADIPVDLSHSGSLNRLINPPAIHLVLPRNEMLSRAFLYQGSGGVVTSLIGANLSGASTSIQVASQHRLTEVVNDICTGFGITKEELAQICNIQSRKTLYNWMNGAKPRKAAMDKIYDLLVTVRAWTSSGFSVDHEQLFRPVVGGKSVFDLLSQPDIDKDLILFAGSRLSLLTPAKDTLLDPFA